MPHLPTVVLLHMGVVLAIAPTVFGNDPPSAEELHQRLESRLAQAPAVSVAYEGELVFENGAIRKGVSYAGAWATRPSSKASMRSDGEMHLVSGITITPNDDLNAKPDFYAYPPNNLFIGPITRRGFFGPILYEFLGERANGELEPGPVPSLGLSAEQVEETRRKVGGTYFLLNPVGDFELDTTDGDDPSVLVLRYSVRYPNGLTAPVRLWLERETLRPIKREIVVRAGDATFTFTERIRAFSTEVIPEPFGENQRATRSVPVIVDYGRWSEQKGESRVETDWLVEGARLRTLEPTRLRILEHGEEATVTLTPGSEFIVHDDDRHKSGLADTPRGNDPANSGEPEDGSPAPQASPHRDGFELLAGACRVEVPDGSWFKLLLGQHTFRESYSSDAAVSVWTASPTRIIVEQGGANELRVNVEYDLNGERPEPQAERTLPNLTGDGAD